MIRTALALSPHLDDAAFSCGGTLATLARKGWRVVLATLFTRSVPDPQGFALACQLDKGLAASVDYMALRRDEDLAASRALGIAPPRHVPLPEAPHRGYDSAAALFGETRPDDDSVGRLAHAIAVLVDDTSPTVIFAPQAIGGHVDHVQVVRALDEVPALGRGRVPVLWWRDFPYTIRPGDPAQPFRARFEALPIRNVALDGAARAAKAAACRAYASQIGFQFGTSGRLEDKLSESGAVETFRGAFDLTP